MKRKSIMVLLIICLLLASFPSRAKAASITPDLSFSGTTASCYVKITQRGKQITATMELWHGTTLVDSWSGNGTNSLTLNETHNGCVSGWTYTLKINGTIGGVAFSEITETATC
ncbi:MAG: hypothetical protein J5493_02955 [Lachnospiraceae bacterium]|nr:hypothetical protein [Lachnospiraceae bacterium]